MAIIKIRSKISLDSQFNFLFLLGIELTSFSLGIVFLSTAKGMFGWQLPFFLSGQLQDIQTYAKIFRGSPNFPLIMKESLIHRSLKEERKSLFVTARHLIPLKAVTHLFHEWLSLPPVDGQASVEEYRIAIHFLNVGREKLAFVIHVHSVDEIHYVKD